MESTTAVLNTCLESCDLAAINVGLHEVLTSAFPFSFGHYQPLGNTKLGDESKVKLRKPKVGIDL